MSSIASSSKALSLSKLTFEQHMLYSSIKFHANTKMGVSIAQLLSLTQQPAKYGPTISHFRLPYKTEATLMTAIKPFVAAGWVLLTTQGRVTKYTITQRELDRAFATGESVGSEEAEHRVLHALRYLYTQPGAAQYHKFPAICWASALAGGAVSSALASLHNESPLMFNFENDDGTMTMKCVRITKSTLPRNSTVFWGLSYEGYVPPARASSKLVDDKTLDTLADSPSSSDAEDVEEEKEKSSSAGDGW
jgi:hypothetical protein